jgi:phosphatidate cytidylyltransferase
MADLFGVLYLTFLLYPSYLLRFDFGERLGLQLTILILAVVWAGDSMALAVGKTFGKTAFAPVISPKKTNEGAVGGLIAGIIAAVVLQHWFFREMMPLVHAIAVAVLAGAFGQLGDLAESMLKRAAEVKDSSNLIPGHGGVLDRIDSLLFAFPVAYIYMLIIHSQH